MTFELSIEHDVEGASVVCDGMGWEPVAMRRIGGVWRARMRLPIDQHV